MTPVVLPFIELRVVSSKLASPSYALLGLIHGAQVHSFWPGHRLRTGYGPQKH